MNVLSDFNELNELVRKAEKLGYVVKNEALVSTRPIDTPTRGYLPKND